MVLIKIIWLLIMTVVSLIVLFGSLWVLRVAVEWWLDVDYVEKIRRWIDERNN